MTRILSIEDDPDMQHLIGEVLFRLGYEIHYSWNGQDGYEKTLSLRPDLLLLDLMLPIMDGVAMLEKVRKNNFFRHTPVVVISAYGDNPSLLKRFDDLEVASYLHKPFAVPELVSCVKNVLSSSESRRSHRPKSAESKEIVKGSLRLNPELRTVWIEGRLIATLPPKSFTLLERLAIGSGPVFWEDLMMDLGYESHEALKKAVQRLREELGDSETKKWILTSSHGYELKCSSKLGAAIAGDQR